MKVERENQLHTLYNRTANFIIFKKGWLHKPDNFNSPEPIYELKASQCYIVKPYLKNN